MPFSGLYVPTGAGRRRPCVSRYLTSTDGNETPEGSLLRGGTHLRRVGCAWVTPDTGIATSPPPCPAGGRGRRRAGPSPPPTPSPASGAARRVRCGGPRGQARDASRRSISTVWPCLRARSKTFCSWWFGNYVPGVGAPVRGPSDAPDNPWSDVPFFTLPAHPPLV